MLARLVVDLLVPAGDPVVVAVDDTLFKRTGPKVHAASWFHDGSATGRHQVGFGNSWVIAAVVVRLPFLERPVALPVGFALVRKGTDAASRLALGRRLVEALVAAVAGRTVHVVADSASAGGALLDLPASITWTTRLRVNAALSALAPLRTGKRGRPRLKGERLAALKTLATTTTFAPTSVHRYGATMQVQTAVIPCLWCGVVGPQQVQVVLVRDGSTDGYDGGPGRRTVRARWSIEVAIEDTKQTTGVGQARNRVRPAVQRTVLFGLVMSTVAICWYATAGYHPQDVQDARTQSPWYRDKAQPSVADMLAKLRRVIITAQFQRTDPQPATPEEINILRLAWADIAA